MYSQARLITAANYKDVIEERTIAKLCGYPLCPNPLGQVKLFPSLLKVIQFKAMCVIISSCNFLMTHSSLILPVFLLDPDSKV